MTAKEKAKEFYKKFRSKPLAYICIEEIIKICPYLSKKECDTFEQLRAIDDKFVSYWEDVKTEIEKL